jgi:hypothetical protein
MWLLLVLCLLVLASGVQRASDQQEQRRASRGVHNNRRIDEKVANMDVNTRKRVLAMKQAGIPDDAIAKKISYEAGNEGTARRMLEKISVEEDKKKWAHQQKQKAHTKSTVKQAKKNQRRRA